MKKKSKKSIRSTVFREARTDDGWKVKEEGKGEREGRERRGWRKGDGGKRMEERGWREEDGGKRKEEAGYSSRRE